MKKILVVVLFSLLILLVSCTDNNNNLEQEVIDKDKTFNYALPSSNIIDKIQSFKSLYNATTTSLYIQDSDNKSFVLGMAKSMPVDVTSQYVDEKWNINDGDVGRAWKIELRNDLCWENNEKIIAQDFIDTIALTYNCNLPVMYSSYYEKISVESGKINLSDIGVRAIGYYTLVLIFQETLTEEKVCDKLSKCDSLLVNETIYKDCFVKNKDGSISTYSFNSYYKNDYGTSPDNYLSYGPYKLVQLDQNGIRLVKNENWFGYKDLTDEYYQTEEIVVDYLEDYSESYSLFIDRKYERIYLDEYLDASNKDSYDEIDKKFIKKGYDTIPSSKLLMFNQNFNNRIVSIPEFRQALIYSLDWNYLLDDVSKNKGYYLYPFYTPEAEINDFTGKYFNETDEFQEVFRYYYGDTSDNGYTNERVKTLLNEAYYIALDEGYFAENDTITIIFGCRGGNQELLHAVVSEWENNISDSLFNGKVKFELNYYTDYDLQKSIVQDIMWFYPLNLGKDLAIEYILTIKEILGISEYGNEELSISFDEIVDVNGKIYRDVSLVTSLSNWITGFKDEPVKTNVIVSGEKTEQVTFLYSFNARSTNKIMAECEKFMFSDYTVIPTFDSYTPILISDNINLNYNTNLHYISEDFRFITYN